MVIIFCEWQNLRLWILHSAYKPMPNDNSYDRFLEFCVPRWNCFQTAKYGGILQLAHNPNSSHGAPHHVLFVLPSQLQMFPSVPCSLTPSQWQTTSHTHPKQVKFISLHRWPYIKAVALCRLVLRLCSPQRPKRCKHQVCVCVCMYVCIYVYVHVCMYVRMYHSTQCYILQAISHSI